MSNVAGVGASTSGAGTTQTKQNKDIMGKDAFLQLLVTQLRYQDPLSPMDDKQFISQMAQFTSLEQSQNMTSQIVRLNAFALLGRLVTIQPGDGGDLIAGLVEGVTTEGSTTKIAVGGTLYTMDQVVQVE